MRMREERDVKMMRIVDTVTYFYGVGKYTAEEAMEKISKAYKEWSGQSPHAPISKGNLVERMRPENSPIFKNVKDWRQCASCNLNTCDRCENMRVPKSEPPGAKAKCLHLHGSYLEGGAKFCNDCTEEI